VGELVRRGADAATLVMTTLDGVPVGHARLMFKVGAHLVADMRSNFKYSDHDQVAGVEREEFDDACQRLRKAGYRLREQESAWDQFSSMRSKYASGLNETTKYLGVPPAPWIGDRSYLPHRERGPSGRRVPTPR